MKANKKTFAALMVLIILLTVFGFVYHIFKPQTSKGEKTFSVKIVHSDNTEKKIDFTSSDEFLGEILLTENIIKGEKGAYGLYITEVDGERAVYEKDKAYWALFINGEYAVSGIDAAPINDGDEFWLVYTAG